MRAAVLPVTSESNLVADVSEPAGSEAYLQRQEGWESNARTYARNLRLAIVKAKGVKVWDADGKEYFDCLAAAGTLTLGHNHPAVLAAVRAALDDGLPFQTLDLTTPAKDAFVEALFATLPEPLASRGRIQFCGPSGSDGIEAAVKLVKTATGADGMLAFHGAYHGMTHGSLAMTGNLGARQAVGGLMPGVQFLPYPSDYRCPFGLGGAQGAEMSSRYIESMLSDPESGVSPAGMVLEAVQGEGGVIPAPDAWLRDIRRITRAHEIPLIIDEVQTGWGRTGKLYAFEHAGIVPDVLVLSKAIGGGLPLSVIVYNEKLDCWKAGAHAGTFRGNQLAMAAGLATLRVIQEEKLVDRARMLGDRFQENLRTIQADAPWLGDVRGRGLMVGVEIVDVDAPTTRNGRPPAASILARQVQRECLKRGLIIELGGRFGSVVRFLPPLIITSAELDDVCAIFREAVLAARRAVNPPSLVAQ